MLLSAISVSFGPYPKFSLECNLCVVIFIGSSYKVCFWVQLLFPLDPYSAFPLLMCNNIILTFLHNGSVPAIGQTVIITKNFVNEAISSYKIEFHQQSNFCIHDTSSLYFPSKWLPWNCHVSHHLRCCIRET